MNMIVGLGNPGRDYANNRHNIGFQCVALLARRHGLSFDTRKSKARTALGAIRLAAPQAEADPAEAAEQALSPSRSPVFDPLSLLPPTLSHRILLVKPQTYMNLSGRSVAALAHFYQIEPGQILVIYDDLDLPLGRIRLRPAGGAGGHNGIKSIIQELGSNEFPRLRAGIDRPPGRMDPADYVLQDFSPAQEEIMAPVRDLVADACEHWLSHGIESAMNAFNGLT